MSSQSAREKGMRTFASDFERIKGNTPKQKETISAPPVPTPVKKASEEVLAVPKPSKVPTPTKTIQKSFSKPDTPKKIPAFHEIEKAVKDIDLSGTGKTKKRSTHPSKGITPSKRVGGGAIITDTRKNSFSLFGESKKGILSWFTSKKKKPTPKLSVPKAERRKGVIQQATTKSGTIFTADNATLKERIKARKLEEKNKPHEPETNWSPYTDAGYNLLESGHNDDIAVEKPATENVVVEFKKRSVPVELPSKEYIPEPEPVVKEIIEYTPVPEQTVDVIPEPMPAPVPVVEKQVPVAVPTPPPVATPDPVPEVEVSAEQEYIPEPEPTAVVEVTPVPEQVAEIITPESEPTPETAPTPEPQQLTGISTNQLTLYVSAGVALIIVTAFFAWVIMGTVNNNDQTDSFDQTSEAISLERYEINQSFSATDLQSYSDSRQYTELILVNAENEALPSALVFDLVTPDLPTAVRQYVTEVRFIQYGIEYPQMVISISDPVSVTGAMLVNESDLAAALSPLYGAFSSNTFVDQTINNTDVRVLGGASMTYGIINDNKLLITTTPEEFSYVSSLLND